MGEYRGGHPSIDIRHTCTPTYTCINTVMHTQIRMYQLKRDYTELSNPIMGRETVGEGKMERGKSRDMGGG